MVDVPNRLRFTHAAFNLRFTEVFNINTVPPFMRNACFGPLSAARCYKLLLSIIVVHGGFSLDGLTPPARAALEWRRSHNVEAVAVTGVL